MRNMVVGASHIVLSSTKFCMIQIVGWHWYNAQDNNNLKLLLLLYMGIMLCCALSVSMQSSKWTCIRVISMNVRVYQENIRTIFSFVRIHMYTEQLSVNKLCMHACRASIRAGVYTWTS